MQRAQNNSFVPLKVAAARLGVPAAWLSNEADADRIPFLRVGRRRMFNVEAVEGVLLERAAQGAGDE